MSVAQISLDEFVKLVFKTYPRVVQDAKEGVEGAKAYLIGLGIKYCNATVSITDIVKEVTKELEEGTK